MNKKGNKKQSFATCLVWVIVFGAAMDKLAVGIALGNVFGTIYYLLRANSDKNSSDEK